MTKRNTLENAAGRTQRRDTAVICLHGVRRIARKDKKGCITALLHHITALNLEPRIFWKNGQEEAAKQRLEAYRKKYGKNPNILVFLMDDVG